MTEELAQLRDDLAQRDIELDRMRLSMRDEHTRSVQFISRLIQACRGHDRELDNRFARVRQLLEEQVPVHQLDTELGIVEKLLHSLATRRQESLRTTLQAVKDSGGYLASVKELPEKLRKEIREFLTPADDSSAIEQQQQIARLLGLYQKATRSLRLNALLGNQSKTNLQGCVMDMDMQLRICDELQRLITELDFGGRVGSQLANIRRRLLSDLEPESLPLICLELVQLIIDGARQERHESHLFLASLNDSLTSVHQHINESLDSGKELHRQGLDNHKHISAHLEDISLQLDAHNSLDQLRNSIQSNVTALQELMAERQVFQLREQQLLDSLASMENKLDLMKTETAEYKKRLTQQEHRLMLDSLTQISNRAALDERMTEEYQQWQQHHQPLGLAVLDIDHFKLVNDRFGHLAGDKALKVIARAMTRSLREQDFVARYGGEEFVILLPRTHQAEMLPILDRLTRVIKSIPFRFKEDKVEITVSVGLTLFREGDKPEDAFERADAALYEAKGQGRDRIILRP